MRLLRLELGLAPVAAEVDGLAVAHRRRRARRRQRRSCRRSGRRPAAAPRSSPAQATSVAWDAPAGCRCRTATIPARIETRDLARRARADVEAGRHVDPGELLVGHAVAAQLRQHAGAALRAARRGRRTAAPPRARGAACAARRGRARRRRARGRRAAGRGARRRPRRPSKPSSPPTRTSARAIGVSPDHEHPRRGQHRLEEHLDRAAREARVLHGDRAVVAGHVVRRAAVRPRRTAGSAAAPPRRSRIACSAYARTLCSAQSPPTKPSIVPSAEHERDVAGLRRWSAAARARRSRSRTARPGRRAPAARRDMAALIIAAARGGPASPPTRAPGCTACRCGRRRASRAARRSPR